MLLNKAKSQAILNDLCGKVTTGTGGWLGVSTVLPTTNPASFSEPPESKNYERVNIADLMNTTYKSVSQGDSAAVDHDRMIGNVSDINFPAAIVPSDPTAASGADWGPLVAFGLFSAKTGGTPYAWGALTDASGAATTVTVLTKNTLHFLKGRFELFLDDANANAST